MPLNESDPRAKLTDPAINGRGWTEDLIRREETAGTIEIIDGKVRKRFKGRVDYTLRVKVHTGAGKDVHSLSQVHDGSCEPHLLDVL
ncbi:MAG: hypothetical protein HY913_24245 [Desulfomonile tiedjei]|nr:hypothetical protein [Desulfomonile tiedjei]